LYVCLYTQIKAEISKFQNASAQVLEQPCLVSSTKSTSACKQVSF